MLKFIKNNLLLAASLFITSTCSNYIQPVVPKETEDDNVSKEIVKLEDMNWKDYTDDDFKLSQKDNKLIFLYFYMEGCGYCEMMEQDTFKNKIIIKVLNHYYVSYKVDGPENIELLKQYSKEKLAFPTLIIFSPKQEPIILIGYKGPGDLFPVIKKGLDNLASREHNEPTKE